MSTSFPRVFWQEIISKNVFYLYLSIRWKKKRVFEYQTDRSIRFPSRFIVLVSIRIAIEIG